MGEALPAQVPTLAGGAVVLRPWQDRDLEVVRRAAVDPLVPLITTVPTSGTTADALAFVERQRQRLPSGVGYSFAVAEPSSDEAVGQIGLWLRDLPDGRASVGYWVERSHRGRGYAAGALDLLSAWALSHDEIHRLQLYVEPRNEASRRTARSCGFEREGLLRSWQEVGGERRDMEMWSRLHVSTPGGEDGASPH